MLSADFQVVLLPRRELVASHCTLAEAAAFQRGYHEAAVAGRQTAVIAPASTERASSSARKLRRPSRPFRPSSPLPAAKSA
jgi:hypothetical protein